VEVVVVVGFKGLRERGRERKERELGSTSTSTKEPRRESALREEGGLIERGKRRGGVKKVEEGGEEEVEEECPSKRRGGRGLKRGKRGLRKEGGREKGRAVAERVGRAFPRKRRVTAEAKRRVAGGKTGEERFGTVTVPRLRIPVLEQAS